MKDPKELKPDTLSLHAGQRPDPTTGARATPIYQTSSFVFDNSEIAAGIFNVERTGHVYSRITNPTNSVLEERISALEGGIGAIATSSGQAAMHLAISTILDSGSHIIASNCLYGGSHNLLEYTFPRFGIETSFIDFRDTNLLKQSFKENTRLVFGETLGNPGLDVMDIETVSNISHENGVPLLVDSTFTTPHLMRPFDLGADLIFHSATKFLSGHGVVIGGLLVDSGNFNWEKSGKFPQLTEPYSGSPHTAFLVLQGIETLGLRMDRHVATTLQIVEYLNNHDLVEKVVYPTLTTHPDHKLASKLLPKGCGAVFTFELKGGREAGKAFIENLSIFSHLANVGDAKSLVIHPASTTHHRMDAASLEKAGISEGTIRLSVGLEDPEDLINDLDLGFRAIKKIL